MLITTKRAHSKAMARKVGTTDFRDLQNTGPGVLTIAVGSTAIIGLFHGKAAAD